MVVMVMKLKNKKGILIKIICTLIGLFLFLFVFFYCHYELTLNGNEQVQILYKEKYLDAGAKLMKCNLLFCRDISNHLTIANNINNAKIGNYEVRYTFENKSVVRQVKVVETEKPMIKLMGSTEINLCSGQAYEEEGYTAWDNYDGDLTNKVEVTREGKKIYYSVSDSSNNKRVVSRTYTYSDDTQPVINLKGDTTIYLNVGDSYKEPGFNAVDNCDGTITDKVTITGNVDTSKGGSYTITYTVSDVMGNKSEVKRKVMVLDFATDDIDSYLATLEKYIQTKNYHVSIGYYNINKNYTYKYNADKVYYGASLIKTLDALYVYENMTLTDKLRSLVKPAIEKSDNTAHFRLVETIGFTNLKRYGEKLEAKYVLTRGSSDYYGNTTVDDQLIYFKYLYNFLHNENIPQANREELKNYFINDYYNYLLFDGLPTTLHKYGYYGAYYHDVGLVIDSSPYIVVILTTEANRDFHIVTDLSQKIYALNKLVA